MLVDQHDTDVLALGGEALEGGLDGRRVRLAVYHEEVLLRVRRVRDVLFRCVSKLNLPVLSTLRRGGGGDVGAFLTPMPASSRPVTES